MNATENPAYDLVEWLCEHRTWSEEIFGPGRRTVGLIKHIKKELEEIEKAPCDAMEWIDVAILALDGAWRCLVYSDHPCEDTGLEELIAGKLWEKQQINSQRLWPKANEDEPSEHVKT